MQQAAQPVATPVTPTQPNEVACEGLPKPIMVKSEPIAVDDPAAGGDGSSLDMSFKTDDDGINGGKIPFKKIFQKRKKSSGE